jgi:purine-binding chemotaxis protein CheW
MSQSTLLDSKAGVVRGGKYLTFALGREEYGLKILQVREIIGYMEVTQVPRMPAHVRGVINLRGQVIPVIDLRAKFAMSLVERTQSTCIIVVETSAADGRKRSTGIVVDRVSEVISVTDECVEDAPEFGASVHADFIFGMAKLGGAVKILLDIDRVLSTQNALEAAEAAKLNQEQTI